MRVMVVEPYLGGSHRAWANGYARFSAHDVTVIGHEARFWKWRMQGGFVTLADESRRSVSEHGPPDVVLASSMLHLPAFLGATRDVLGGAAATLFMHENQLTYPPTPGTDPDLTYPMINWVSMTAADRVFFNSGYHRSVWFDALPNLLKHFPDYTHNHLIQEVRARSDVLGVGVDLSRLDGPRRREGAPLILWNQRWEYDKNPGQFLDALDALAGEGLPFRVALAGESFSTEPGRFEQARDRLGDRVVHFGYAAEPEYVRLLRDADVVVSTAYHEFFGISIVEAVYAGAFPVLPDRLAYPGHLPAEHHDACLYPDFDGLVRRLRWALTHPGEASAVAAALKPAVAAYDWSVLGPEYDRRLEEIVQRVSPPGGGSTAEPGGGRHPASHKP